MKIDISNDGWFFICLSVIAICIACGFIFSSSKGDNMSEQIISIRNSGLNDEAKKELIANLIKQYNPTNNISLEGSNTNILK